MKPVEFEHSNAVLAKDQPEYLPLPVHRTAEGEVTSCWELSPEERLLVAKTGRIYVTMLTFGRPVQPLIVAAEFKP